jgi:hypothetical protein
VEAAFLVVGVVQAFFLFNDCFVVLLTGFIHLHHQFKAAIVELIGRWVLSRWFGCFITIFTLILFWDFLS